MDLTLNNLVKIKSKSLLFFLMETSIFYYIFL